MGSESALKISDAELTSLDLDIIGQNTASKAYDGSGELRVVSISSLDSLTLDIGQINVSSLESVSRGYGRGSAFKIEAEREADCGDCEPVLRGDANPDDGDKVTALVLTITGQNTASAAYDGNAVLRAVSISRLESLTLEIAQADHVGSLEGASSGYGEESAFRVRDAELTGFDLKIKENTEAREQLLVCGNRKSGLG